MNLTKNFEKNISGTASWSKVYIGLGSNLGDREKNIKTALELLKEEKTINLLRASAISETDPEENLNQPKFLNAVCETQTSLSPVDLLDKLKKIEYKVGRPKEYEKNSPRIIDLDILVFDDLLLKGRTLIIPHPKMHKRYFVLNGLNELAPDLLVPGHKKSVKQLLSELLDDIYASNQ
ncbi:MAG: 2-amino-4-hydroxy-6-hydroxymethyldihydropteridine diphosphokinase [Candidatus Omnitrophota bacterium]